MRSSVRIRICLRPGRPSSSSSGAINVNSGLLWEPSLLISYTVWNKAYNSKRTPCTDSCSCSLPRRCWRSKPINTRHTYAIGRSGRSENFPLANCAPCHGYNGEGGRGPNLAAGRFYHGSTDLDLFNNVSNGIPGTEMPGNFYSADRIWQIVGDRAVIYGLRGRISNRRLPSKVERQAIRELRKPECRDFGPTYAAEHIQKRLGIRVGKNVTRAAAEFPTAPQAQGCPVLRSTHPAS